MSTLKAHDTNSRECMLIITPFRKQLRLTLCSVGSRLFALNILHYKNLKTTHIRIWTTQSLSDSIGCFCSQRKAVMEICGNDEDYGTIDKRVSTILTSSTYFRLSPTKTTTTINELFLATWSSSDSLYLSISCVLLTCVFFPEPPPCKNNRIV